MSLALNEEALTLLFVSRLLVVVHGVVVSNYFLTRKPLYIKHLKGMSYSHSIVPGGFEVMSYVILLMPGTSLIIRLQMRAKNSCSKG